MANINNNRVNTSLTEEQINSFKTAIQNIYTQVPFLTGLTVEERIALPKINVVNKVFVEDSINAIDNNSSILPNYLNVNNIKTDLLLFSQLDELTGLVRQLLEKLEDTQILAGSEAYVSALTGYKLFGAAADAGLPGADAIYDSLKTRFTYNPETKSTLEENKGTL